MRDRFILISVFWALSMVAMYLFAGGGDGSYVPVAILSSWTAFLITPTARQFSIGMNETELYVAVFSGLFLVYIIILNMFSWILKRFLTNTFSKRLVILTPWIFHAVGSFLVLIYLPYANKLPRYGVNSSYFFMSYVISAMLLISYLYLDFQIRFKAKDSGK